MKKLILYITLLLPVLAWGQTNTLTQQQTQSVYQNQPRGFGWYNGVFQGWLGAPIGNTANLNGANGQNGLFYFQTSDTTLRVWLGNKFVPFGGGASSSSSLYFTPYFTGTGTNTNPLTLAISPMAQDWIFNTNTHKFGLLGLGHTSASGDSSLLVGTDGTVKKGVASSTNIYNSDGALTGNRNLSNSGHYLNFDSLYLASPNVYTTPSGTIHFVGTSITAGSTGPNPIGKRYSTVLSTMMGLTEDNQGRPGTTLGNPSRGTNSLVNTLTVIPSKGTGTQWLIFEYAPNDIISGTSYGSVQFNTDYHTVINYALAHGWDAAHIIIMIGGYLGNNVIPSGFTATQFQARQDSFNNVMRNLAISYGTKSVEIAKIMTFNGGMAKTGFLAANGGNLLYLDGLHPNNSGDLLIARSLYAIMNNIQRKGQALAVNGVAEIQDVKTPNLPFTRDSLAVLTSIDSAGRLRKIGVLPNNISTVGNFYPNGKVVQTNSLLPDSSQFPEDGKYHPYDNIWNNKQRIITGYSSGGASQYWTMIEPADAGMSMNFYTGPGAGDFNFYTNAANLNLNLHRNDTSANFGGNVYLPNRKSIGANPSGFFAGITPFSSAATTNIFNDHHLGGFNVLLSDGVDFQDVQMFHMNAFGRTVLQENGDATDYFSSRFTVNSTKEGILIPRMTQTQRDAMDKIYSITAISSGSGYTHASVSLSGSTGSGFAATANISGGGIQSWTITNAGTGYLTPQTATVTGDGTGSTAIVTIMDIGVQIYNTTSGKIDWYDGTQWQEVGTGGGGGTVTAVTGTTNRITSTGGTTPQIDISASYVGQSSITTVGTLSAGSIPYSLLTGTVPTWNQNTTGTAANITATSNSTLTTLPNLSLPYSQLTGTPTIPTAANPSGLIGLTANNGSATTFTRSDATHALDQSIAPTWTGIHTYQQSSLGTTQVPNIISLTNTPAALGSQQNSGLSVWQANAFNPTASASQTVAFGIGVGGVQGNLPTGNMTIYSNINNAGWLGRVTINSSGSLALGGSGSVLSNARSGLTTTVSDGLLINDPTLSTSVATISNSGSVHLQAHLWNTTATAADNFADATMYLTGTSGTIPNPILTIGLGLGTTSNSSPTTRLTIDGSGIVTASNFTMSGNLALQTGSTFATADFASSGTAANAQTTAGVEINATQTYSRFLFNGGSAAAPAASNYYTNGIIGNTAGITAPATGTTPGLYQLYIKGLPTVTNASAIPITETANLNVEAQSTAGTANYGIKDQGNLYVVDVLNASTNSVVSGSTSGNATFAQPEKGTAWKVVKIYLAAMNGSASYTFPTPFTHTPVVTSTNGLSTTLVSSLSTTATTVTTSSATTGYLIIEGD